MDDVTKMVNDHHRRAKEEQTPEMLPKWFLTMAEEVELQRKRRARRSTALLVFKCLLYLGYMTVVGWATQAGHVSLEMSGVLVLFGAAAMFTVLGELIVKGERHG